MRTCRWWLYLEKSGSYELRNKTQKRYIFLPHGSLEHDGSPPFRGKDCLGKVHDKLLVLQHQQHDPVEAVDLVRIPAGRVEHVQVEVAVTAGWDSLNLGNLEGKWKK